jgi:hypothetical protein
LVHGIKLWFWEAVVEAVVPDVDAPEGSVAFGFIVIGWRCLGCVPDVDGVVDECVELDEDEPLELISGGAAGAGGDAVGATGWVGA